MRKTMSIKLLNKSKKKQNIVYSKHSIIRIAKRKYIISTKR